MNPRISELNWSFENQRRETRNSKLETPSAYVDFQISNLGLPFALMITMCLMPTVAGAMGFKKKSQPTKDYLADYIERVKAVKALTPVTGGFWTPQSPYTDMASDYKARNVNDLIVIQIVESTSAAEDGAVKSARTLSASSGISAFMGTPGPTAGIQNIFSPSSSRTLNGQAQSSSDATLTTSLSGRVVDVLPNGFLVIEAERELYMNNQHQTVVVHGIVRPGDIGANNAVPSTSISNLEVELKGKGVISDGVAPPNTLMRMILKLVGF